MRPPPITEQGLRRRVAVNARRLRVAAGMTLEEVADKAGIDWRHWQKVERGSHSITMRTLANVANGLGVDPSVLVGPVPGPDATRCAD